MLCFLDDGTGMDPSKYIQYLNIHLSSKHKITASPSRHMMYLFNTKEGCHSPFCR